MAALNNCIANIGCHSENIKNTTNQDLSGTSYSAKRENFDIIDLNDSESGASEDDYPYFI